MSVSMRNGWFAGRNAFRAIRRSSSIFRSRDHRRQSGYRETIRCRARRHAARRALERQRTCERQRGRCRFAQRRSGDGKIIDAFAIDRKIVTNAPPKVTYHPNDIDLTFKKSDYFETAPAQFNVLVRTAKALTRTRGASRFRSTRLAPSSK